MMRLRRRMDVAAAYGRWRNKEAGVSDAVTAMLVLPFIMALIFILIELGFNFSYRAKVDSIVQDTVRGIAQDGANYAPKTSTLSQTYGPSGAKGGGWTKWGSDQLLALCGTPTTKRCNGAAPTITCSIGGGNVTGVTSWAAPQYPVGSTVRCTGTMNYKGLAGFTSNQWFTFGFSKVWDTPISTTITSRTVVGDGT